MDAAVLRGRNHRSKVLGRSAFLLFSILIHVAVAEVKAEESSKILYVHSDHLGTPVAMTDQSGSLVLHRDQFPFGSGAAVVGIDDSGVRFPGQMEDRETGLHYNYHRYFDPSTGRYVSSDPIGLVGGVSTYTYAASNPIRYSDPTGLIKWKGTFAGGTLFTAGGYWIVLESECVDGRKATVYVAVAGPGIGADLQGSATSGSIDFVEPLAFIYPEIFRGTAMVASLSLAIPPTPSQRVGRDIVAGSKDHPDGWSCGVVKLGVAGSKGCTYVRGLAVGGSFLFGTATPVDVDWEVCDECSD